MTSIMRRTASLCLLFVLLASGARAQQQAAVYVAPSTERLRAHVTYLAGDKLDGRRTGTQGAMQAAEYIAAEFKRLGLKPGGTGEISFSSGPNEVKGQTQSYYQMFPYVAAVELGKGNAMTFMPKTELGVGVVPAPALDLRLHEDWLPLAWSASGRVERSAVVYVGYGITATDLQHDDYAGVDVKDKIALAFVGTPDGDNPHGQFARYNDLRFKAAAARDHGARALFAHRARREFQGRQTRAARAG